MAVVDPEPFAFILLAIGLPIAVVCLYVGFFRWPVSPDKWRRYTERKRGNRAVHIGNDLVA
jgi:hypothetical protein